MNIYESMNKAFDAEISKIQIKKQNLTESVEAGKEVEFQPIAIPAPFDKYYRVLQPEEYMSIVGFPYDEMTESAADYGVDEIQYIIAKDDLASSLGDAGMEILSVYKDGDAVGVGEEVGGRLFPIDYTDIQEYITECVKPVTEGAEVKNEDTSPMEKLEKAYPELDVEEGGEEVEAESESKSPVKQDAMEKLRKAYPELNEAKDMSFDDDDLWTKIYGELTMDGKQVMKGKSTQFNRGAGYDYARQIHVDTDGSIWVEADTIDELKPAADIAIAHKDEGVTYKLCRGKKGEKFAYCIKICIPEDMEESTSQSLKEKVEAKNGGMSPLEKLKKAYPELNLD